MLNEEPLLCSRCATEARAELEDEYLCTGCLMATLMGTYDPVIIEKIVPLNLTLNSQLRSSEAVTANTDLS